MQILTLTIISILKVTLSVFVCYKISGYENKFFTFSTNENKYPLANELIATLKYEKRAIIGQNLLTEKIVKYQLIREKEMCDKKLVLEGSSNDRIFTIVKIDIARAESIDSTQKYIFEVRSSPNRLEMILQNIYGHTKLHAEYLFTTEDKIWDNVSHPFIFENYPMVVPQPYSRCLWMQNRKLNMYLSLENLDISYGTIFENSRYLIFSFETNVNGNPKKIDLIYSIWTYQCDKNKQSKIDFVTSQILPGSRLSIEFYDKTNKIIDSAKYIYSLAHSKLIPSASPLGNIIKVNLIPLIDVPAEYEHKYIYLDNISLRPMQCLLLSNHLMYSFVARQLKKTKFRLTFHPSGDLNVPGMIFWRPLYENEEWDNLVFGSTPCNWREQKNFEAWLNPIN